ncbi:MAG TPA: Wzz/FepE/Etk N-terminal domain-containing protein [Candidatus Acidoferrales bacterium]|nr:Wzz/FepE/Etk N-terminal domain-containing protein [Candidatus Acidoferrales bacterium]
MSAHAFEPLPGPGGLVEDAQGDGAALALRPLAAALWARRVTLAIGALVGATLLLGLAFVLPPTYVATVAVLEAPRPDANTALDQLGISAQMLGLKPGGGATNALTYPDILRSRRLLESLLVRSFPLADGHAVPLEGYLASGPGSPQRRDRAVRALRRRFDITLDRRTNLLRLAVSDRDPVLAAGVANAACAALQDLVMHAMMTQAGANRRFVENRLDGARTELAQAEAGLEAFREANRHVDDSPRLLLEQGRMLREVRTREEVVVALTREYEMARVDENRDVPVLNVLDPAVPPAFRSSPRRVPMAVAGFLLGLVVAAAVAWPRRGAAPVREAHAEAA